MVYMQSSRWTAVSPNFQPMIYTVLVIGVFAGHDSDFFFLVFRKTDLQKQLR